MSVRSVDDAIVETLVRGMRAEAKRRRTPPLELWPDSFGSWLVTLCNNDDELVLAVLRDSGAKLRGVEGVAEIVIDGRAMRCPSKAAALEIAQLVYLHCDLVPDDRAVRRAMALLESRARSKARVPA